MPDKFLKPIQQLLKQKIGLEPSLVNTWIWRKNILKRMEANAFHASQDYYHRLLCSGKELEEFIELFLVPETWFFREEKGLEFAVERCVHLLRSGRRDLAIACIPCSSGEEPYSLAMALFEAGLKGSQFKIEAFDISKKGIKKAKLALYGSYSFRGRNEMLKKKYFNSHQGNFLLKKEVIHQVHFEYGNLLDPQFCKKGPYDLIICRNLLIYFSKENQRQAIENCLQVLVSDGVLLLGQAEGAMVGKDSGFTALTKPPINAFIPTKHTKPAVPIVQETSQKNASKPIELKQSISILAKARALADAGLLEEAKALCQKRLKEQDTDEEAYFLLGIIAHAENMEKEAENYFHKTIYLSPNHCEALVYLALLADRKGDVKKAELYKRRALKAVKS